MPPMLSILIVDQEPASRLSLSETLDAAGHKVKAVGDLAKATEALAEQPFDVIVTELHLPDGSGMDLLRTVRRETANTEVVVLVPSGANSDAVTALREGARDSLSKPVSAEELVIRIDRIAESRVMRDELNAARTRLQSTRDGGVVGRSPMMVRLNERVATMAASEVPVLVTGESGTGKELVARLLHQQSLRASRPFIAVNCAAFPDALIEAELFGYERGAIAGALKGRDGRFKAADGGTLFLDEVAEIPLPVQAKLLRVIQEGTLEPLGSNTPVPVNVRIISATHRNLKRQIAEGKFREDLYYRLNVLNIHIPPLRERRGDLPLLIGHFLSRLTPPGKTAASMTPRAYTALTEYLFPGNVRELKHAIEHAVVLARGQDIDIEHLPEDILGSQPAGDKPPQPTVRLQPLATAVKQFEQEYLLRALERSRGKKSEAAALLGISRKNLWEKLRAYGIGNPPSED